MNAYYVRSEVGEEVQTLADALLAAGLDQHSRARTITPNGDAWNDWQDGKVCHSMHAPSSRSLFRVAAVSPKLRLFDNPWTVSLLAQINQSVAANGALILPVMQDRRADSLGFVSRSAMIRRFGEPEWEDSQSGMARFLPSPSVTLPRSTLSWLFEDFGMVALDYSIYRVNGNPRRLAEACLDLLIDELPADLQGESDPDAMGNDSVDLNQTVPWFVKWANYAVGGIGYKSAIIQFIINRYLGEQRELTTLDVGGGAGLLAAELLLLNPRIRLAVVREPIVHNLVPARRLSRFYPELSGRFAMSIGFGEDMADDRRYDVITMIGSLLYVPRDKTAEVLDHAWEKLNPGGILIVHENIKNPSFKKDYEVMFTVEELNQLLGKYEAIDCFLSTATKQIDTAEAGQKTAFRVVRKA